MSPITKIRADLIKRIHTELQGLANGYGLLVMQSAGGPIAPSWADASALARAAQNVLILQAKLAMLDEAVAMIEVA